METSLGPSTRELGNVRDEGYGIIGYHRRSFSLARSMGNFVGDIVIWYVLILTLSKAQMRWRRQSRFHS